MSDWISYSEPPVMGMKLPFPGMDSVTTLVRREDLNHATVSGNKWWKLKYNLRQAITDGHTTVLTFGGAYSNHIYATAAACRELQLSSIGIIRGEEVENSTLAFAKSCGMKLHFISREEYRKKNETGFLDGLESKFGKCYVIPEGGTNALAVRGCEELGEQLLKSSFDYVMLPVGTGGTIAGIINALKGKRKIIGIPVLKNGRFLQDEIQKLLRQPYDNWKLYFDYHQSGYAKTNRELDEFIAQLEAAGIPTEFVYTGKLFRAAVDLIHKKAFEPGATVLILHTGGLRT